MIWPMSGLSPNLYYASARLKQVISDEVGGNLRIKAIIDEREEKEIVYEGMYYSQLDEDSVGLVINLVTEIRPEQYSEPEFQQAIARLYDDCGVNEWFLWIMQKRGNRLYIHFTDRGKFIVLAKQLLLE